MSSPNPSIISHVSVGTNRFEEAVAFYDRVLATLGCRRMETFPVAAAYGRMYPEFWVGRPHDGGPAAVGNGIHVGFIADTPAHVDAFHAEALAAGGISDGAPGPRPLYGPQYYGCFVRDLDGNKIEAAFWDETMDAPPR